ncbi:B3 domain-containing protein [Zea mays]|uniref:B3 domain-containing protein n=1 Tax=Zea mays TaxID=4577 RepID=A0A1D6NL58_MAIZE|nr:B3 domain-containing protein [Zea mays]
MVTLSTDVDFFFVVPLPSPFQIHFVSLVHELCAPPFSCRFLVVVYTISFLYFLGKIVLFQKF